MGFLGAAAGVAGDIYGAVTAGDAAKQQAKAIDKAIRYTEKNIDPDLINAKAILADINRAKTRLDLQKQIDPALYAQRYASEGLMRDILSQVGREESDKIAAIAAREAAAQSPEFIAAKNKLIDAALAEAGGALPPDIQAELMKAGLEQTGTVTGAAMGARGAGGAILQQVLGSGGLALQTQAANLLKTASDLDANRQQILQGLFPKLQEQQMTNLKAAMAGLSASEAAMPEAGLSGADIANIWLARVGAVNKLMTGRGQVEAGGTQARNAAITKAISGAGALAGFTGGLTDFLKKKTPAYEPDYTEPLNI